jgi:hypothetical protein
METPRGRRAVLMRAVVWIQIVIIVGLIGYSTYSLFQGDFEQALLPYPILILYYLFFARRKTKATSSTESQNHEARY